MEIVLKPQIAPGRQEIWFVERNINQPQEESGWKNSLKDSFAQRNSPKAEMSFERR